MCARSLGIPKGWYDDAAIRLAANLHLRVEEARASGGFIDHVEVHLDIQQQFTYPIPLTRSQSGSARRICPRSESPASFCRR